MGITKCLLTLKLRIKYIGALVYIRVWNFISTNLMMYTCYVLVMYMNSCVCNIGVNLISDSEFTIILFLESNETVDHCSRTRGTG